MIKTRKALKAYNKLVHNAHLQKIIILGRCKVDTSFLLYSINNIAFWPLSKYLLLSEPLYNLYISM